MNRTLHYGRLLSATLAVALLPMSVVLAENSPFVVDSVHSTVQFKIRHLLTKVTGNFRDFSGSIVYDAESASGSSVEFSVSAKSIDTANAKRDSHLRSPDFFDTEKFPTLSFKSMKVRGGGNGKLDVTGELTIHGVTREVELPIIVNGVMESPSGGMIAGFETTFTIDRADYGIVSGGVMLGSDVEIYISIESGKSDEPSD